MTDSHTPCFQALDLAQMGAACLLASGKASSKITKFSNGISILVEPESLGAQLEKCLPWYDVICLTGAGISIS